MTDRLDEIEADMEIWETKSLDGWTVSEFRAVCQDIARRFPGHIRYLISRVREAEEQFREMVDRLFVEQQEVRRLRAAIGDECWAKTWGDDVTCLEDYEDSVKPAPACPVCQLQENET